MDVMTPEQRYRAMAHNRGRTHPERALASALWGKGLRYLTDEGYQARYGHRLPGHPDLVFVGCRAVVFVDGCFWHGCRVCDTGVDRSSEFWQRKISANRERDRRTTEQLEKDGWRVVRVFEHDIKTKADLQSTAERIVGLLRSLDKEGR
jgi:DNA mismatch endonuclease (patch repair protein)